MVPFPALRQHLVFWIVLGFVTLGSARFLATTLPGGDAFRERRGFALQHVLRMSKPLLESGRGRELVRYLRDAQATGLVDYFEVTEGSRVDTGGAPPSARPVLTEAVSARDGWVWGRMEGREVALRLASGFDARARLADGWQREQSRLPFDLCLFALVCGLSLWFQRKARRQAARGAVELAVPRRESRRARPGPPARESVPVPAEPGEFDGVCGRSSLLNQAERIRGDGAAKVFAALEEFYADGAALIDRYQGKLLGVHGHELLFYFAEGDPERNARLALAAASGLAQLGSRHGFALGTALAAGRLHGAPVLSGYALFGGPVEETRELAQAQAAAGPDGDIWLTEALAKIVDRFAELRAVGGRRPAHGARALLRSPDVADALGSARRDGTFSALAYHRGDGELTEVLRALATGAPWERDTFVGVLSELRRVSCRRCGPGVVDAYRALLAAELARKDTYRLSSVVALAPALLQRGVIDRSLERLFLQAVAVKDRRVRANAVELFTRFYPEREIPELRPLIRDEDNRVSANALIKAACERFDEKVIGRLDERLRSGSVAHVASALHAMGEIAVYYRKHDPLFLGTKLSFLRLFDGVPAWANHPNTMIRRQALIAARKLESAPVDARIRELFATCVDPELVGLFASIYGWRKDDVGAAA